MIIEMMFNVFVGLMRATIGGSMGITLPVGLVAPLGQVAKYGSYVVGSDLLLSVCVCVFAWMTVRLTAGLIIFVWKLLPFT